MILRDVEALENGPVVTFRNLMKVVLGDCTRYMNQL